MVSGDLRTVPRDGNCLFHAISLACRLHGYKDVTSVCVKKKVLEWIRAKWSSAPYSESETVGCIAASELDMHFEDAEAYVAYMQTASQWGGWIELVAVCALFGFDVNLVKRVSTNRNKWQVCNTITKESNRSCIRQVFLRFRDRHYDVVVPTTPFGSKPCALS